MYRIPRLKEINEILKQEKKRGRKRAKERARWEKGIEGEKSKKSYGQHSVVL